MDEISRRDNAEVRLSAAERDEAVARIQAAYADGRLEEQELDRRLRDALDAVYGRDLEPLLKRRLVARASSSATGTGARASPPLDHRI
jgi:hypothetical protein